LIINQKDQEMGITLEQFKSLKPQQRVMLIDAYIWERMYPGNQKWPELPPYGKICTVLLIVHESVLLSIEDTFKQITVPFYLIEKIIEEESGITSEEFQQLKPGQKVRFKKNINRENPHILTANKMDLLGKICTINTLIISLGQFTIDARDSMVYHYSIIAEIININNENKSEIPPSEPESLLQRLRREDQKEKKRLETQEEERWINLVTEISKPRKILFRFDYVVENLKVTEYLVKRLIAEGFKCNVTKTMPHETTYKIIVQWN